MKNSEKKWTHKRTYTHEQHDFKKNNVKRLTVRFERSKKNCIYINPIDSYKVEFILISHSLCWFPARFTWNRHAVFSFVYVYTTTRYVAVIYMCINEIVVMKIYGFVLLNVNPRSILGKENMNGLWRESVCLWIVECIHFFEKLQRRYEQQNSNGEKYNLLYFYNNCTKKEKKTFQKAQQRVCIVLSKSVYSCICICQNGKCLCHGSQRP